LGSRLLNAASFGFERLAVSAKAATASTEIAGNFGTGDWQSTP